MGNSSKQNHDLRTLSKFKAILIARRYLMVMFLLLTLYVGYHGYTLVPFYLCGLLALLPSLLHNAFMKEEETRTSLVYVSKNLGYSNQKYKSLQVSFSLTQVLLFLWTIRYYTSPPKELWLKISPTILIISSLLIVTIGQYYYFHKFHDRLMRNEIDQIR